MVLQTCPLSKLKRYSPWGSGVTCWIWAVTVFGRAGFASGWSRPSSPNFDCASVLATPDGCALGGLAAPDSCALDGLAAPNAAS